MTSFVLQFFNSKVIAAIPMLKNQEPRIKYNWNTGMVEQLMHIQQSRFELTTGDAHVERIVLL